MKYANGKIYKLVSNLTDKVYIGSTCSPLCKRHKEHKGHYKRYLKGKGNKVTSFDIIKHGDSDIVLLEEFPCDNIYQLHDRERYYVETIDCVNKCIPNRTKKEYYENNKDEIIKQRKEHYENNKGMYKEYYKLTKDKIKERISTKSLCLCGGIYRNDSKYRHMRCHKHKNNQQFINWAQQNDPQLFQAIQIHQNLINFKPKIIPVLA
jgi:hypothetical protein